MINRKRFVLLGWSMLVTLFAMSVSRASADVSAYRSEVPSEVDLTTLERVLGDSTLELKSVVINSYGSPKGSYSHNAKMVQKHADKLRKKLVGRYNLPESKITILNVAEDWAGVENFILQSEIGNLSNRDSLLEIVRDSNISPDEKEKLIKKKFKSDYEYLKENCFPKLNRVSYTLDYKQKEYDTIYRDGYEYKVERTNQEPASAQEISQSFDSQKVQNDNLGAEKLITDTIHGDALVSFLVNEAEMRSDSTGNQQDLDKITAMLDQVMTDQTIRLQRIIISGYASPDGPYAKNARLAENRTNILKEFIEDRYNVSNDLIETHSVAEDWDGLERFVENASDSDLLNKQAILDIIRSNQNLDVKERKIKSFKKDFEYLKENCLPQLRRSEYYIQYFKDSRFVTKNIIDQPEPEPEPVVIEPEEKKPFYIAAKTNLLYDAAFVPNIGVELYFGNQWTVSADWFYNWWYSDRRHRYWQGYGGYLGVRKYFGSKAEEHPFTGHHIGLYGLMMTYDVEWGGRGYQSPDWGFGGGIEYGYSLPIARRLNLDFSLGIGYQDGEYKEYLPMDGHYVWQSTHQRHWFGPTKAEVSLKWLIGRGNYHKKYGKNKTK